MMHHGLVSAPLPTGKPNARMRQTVGDMVRSLALVFGVIALILLVTLRPQPDPVRVVDPAPVLAAARASAPFMVVIPPEQVGYQVTSARWAVTPASGAERVWHIGYVTPTTEYVQVIQSAAQGADFVQEQTAGGAEIGSVDVNGTRWQRWETTDRRSLVLASPTVTTIVSGTVSIEELMKVAGSLAG